MARTGFVVLSLAAGSAVAFASWHVRDELPWWSSMLGNLALALYLLIPGELVLTWMTARFDKVDQSGDKTRAVAEAAKISADRAEKSLEDVRQTLLGRQRDEHEAALDVYRSVERDLSRDKLIAALRQAAAADFITSRGVRVPIWQTDLHYRFVVDKPEGSLEVRLETDDMTVVSSHLWDASAPPETFLQVLVEAVRAAGRDLGVGLNDPTESLLDLSRMLVEVARHCAQDLMGYRDTLHKIIERVDGWYFTESMVVPSDDLRYGIPLSRLDEMDWEEHLRSKGWYGAGAALHFARVLHGAQVKDR
jgi:hypothetical protein